MLWQNRIFLTIFALSLLLVQKSFCQTDTLLQGEYLKYERELVSPLNIFKLKFFKFENSDNWYFGIWYINAYVQDRAVWIANRNNPISERSGSGRLIVDSFGRLRILRGASSLLELSSTKTTRNTTLKLLDSGNLQLQEMDSNGSMWSVLWQSFDYPTDTLLPGMKLGFNVKTGKKWELTSYLGDTLPVSGSFVFGMDANITNQLTILWRGNIFWESGLWFEGGFSLEELNRKGFVFSFVSTEAEHYFMYSTDQSYERPLFPRIMIDQQGILHIYMLHTPSIYLKSDYCSLFSPEKKNICYSQYSSRVNEGFLFADMAYKAGNCSPFASTFTEMRSSSLDNGFVLNETGGRFSRYDCYVHCLQNCSCLAYASAHVDGTGCEIWNTDPTNKGLSSHRDRRTISIRQKEYVYHEKNQKAPVWLVVVTSVCLMISLIWLLIYLVLRKLQIKVTAVIRGLFYFVRGLFYFIHREIIPQMMGCIRRKILSQRVGSTIDQEILLRELGIDRRRQHKRSSLRKNNNELQIFSFESVALATDYFSSENKLGEGGFGPVYKGRLIDGGEVAIKRLSLASGQGLVGFKNEAMLIAKLQHTNLVQLMGCCIDKDEKMLIYEYMPNKSLDYFIFDPLRKNIMDWTLRFRIMEGIIQGLLYLHKYSRLKVIHRDIKASNILLDEDMSPKISDFGMARIFGAQESKANTNRVAGTFGYMSPEYFREGLFSAKSDVFSFGVLMLEIICGRKNNSFNYESEGPLNLIVHVWNLFKENRVCEVIDPSLGDSALENPQVLRCVQVALLCVQENAEDRPSMLDVVSMIYGEGNNALSLPKEPAFYDGPRRSSPEIEVVPPEMENVSVNRVTISVMEAR
ncbi:G-type lectin S-receptor-like serine/threonine-protein kinase [Cardamine amara subsp. amara]|uniref:Receptor-like serine/threonine-protein kinase n=1 Tax=Cardamine amara subsp. amara TaxID=228776 RepID=A0ABD0ZYK0_CARAN